MNAAIGRTNRGAPRVRLIAAGLAVLLSAMLPAATPQAVLGASGAPIAQDAFSRVVATGWGSAEAGGAYSYDPGNGAFSADGTVGSVILNKAGANRAAYLTAAQARDVDVSVRIALDKLPSGGGAWAYVPVRHNGTNEYRPKLIVTAAGAVNVQAGAVVSGAETAVAPAVPTAITPAAGSFIWLRTVVTGANPTTVQVKAWPDGTAEPGTFQFSATNSQPALQVAGVVGLRAYVSSVTNAPIVASFDDFNAFSLDAPPAPVAGFSAAQEPTTLTVDFTDTTSGPVDAWAWNFGDGATSTDENPIHDYATDGTFSVTLNVSGAGGNSSSAQDVVVEPVQPPPPPTTLANDDFGRTAASLWAAAPTGGIWSYQGRLADFSLDGTAGRITLPSANQTRSAFLLSTLATDVDLSFSVSLDKPPTGAALFVYGTARRTVDGYAYRPKLRFATNGNVYVQASRVTASGESALGPEVRVVGLAQLGKIHVRALVSGSSPTTVQVKAWSDGTTEPDAWQFSATDSTAALQSAGSLGVLAYLSSGATNAPVTVSIDDFVATTTNPVPRVAGVAFTGAGDIASCGSQGDEQTARLLNLLPGDVFTVGDNVYPNATTAEFANCYDPSWGTVKDRTHPAVGNHEYNTSGAAPYYAYFGAAAGDPSTGYYAFNEGSWRVYVLNSNCGFVSCAAGSAQEQWLRADLAANPTQCALAISHAPRFSSGSEHGSQPSMQPLWQALYDNGVEMLLSGHDHDYERFAPMNGAGAADPNAGTRQFVVGTGGASHGGLTPNPLPTTEYRQASTYGVFQLVLGDGAYEWEFIPIAGQVLTDRGSGTCH
jgi:PKD repeat protein